VITVAIRAFAIGFMTVFTLVVAFAAGWDAADRLLRRLA
jgi:hypothetical protein